MCQHRNEAAQGFGYGGGFEDERGLGGAFLAVNFDVEAAACNGLDGHYIAPILQATVGPAGIDVIWARM